MPLCYFLEIRLGILGFLPALFTRYVRSTGHTDVTGAGRSIRQLSRESPYSPFYPLPIPPLQHTPVGSKSRRLRFIPPVWLFFCTYLQIAFFVFAQRWHTALVSSGCCKSSTNPVACTTDIHSRSVLEAWGPDQGAAKDVLPLKARGKVIPAPLPAPVGSLAGSRRAPVLTWCSPVCLSVQISSFSRTQSCWISAPPPPNSSMTSS